MDPTRVPEEGNIFEEYPILKKYKIFTKRIKGLDNQKIMQWIMCVYDQGTPYREKFENIIKRKTEAGRDVGFKITEGGLFEESVEQFMKGMNSTVNAKIVEYVRRHRSMKYSYFVAMENSYYKIMEQVEGGDVTRIKELRSMQEEMETTLIEILNQDDSHIISDTVLRYIEEERLAIRPEDIAIKLSKGEVPIPYKEVKK
jgi:hypothetical protein